MVYEIQNLLTTKKTSKAKLKPKHVLAKYNLGLSSPKIEFKLNHYISMSQEK